MHRLRLLSGDAPKRILALGAHADDIEIGCGGTTLRLAAERPDAEVLWVVLAAADEERASEADASAPEGDVLNEAPRGGEDDA